MRQVLLIIDVQPCFTPPAGLVDGINALLGRLPSVTTVEHHDENVTLSARQRGRQPNPGTRWALEQDGQLIGSCGLFKWNRGWNSCALSCELAAPARGQGLMSEALRAMLAWGFAHMHLHRVEAMVHPHNAASQALLERLGFKAEGTLREAGFWNGQRHDLVVLGLLAREWLDK
ncbi:Acetyltransferase (GNAT) domain-containing protein [Pseudomonas antarctica]|uniref:Acetyltransferase (GNAT) domain-containing protein n=1 Tax=Pseudomonas antarctica TaxID=219572 RepID=A0A1H0C7H0_9PSED|nr:GNAT family protein [Pseudomonas antarctica]KAF2406857.1 putative ribosomal N-acetyltransferase YdaF [Pseudomonas antarctica]SDN53776.1 Acetyltransferase (GNAT) domain-containing protein [Pseudomonas antarctica]